MNFAHWFLTVLCPRGKDYYKKVLGYGPIAYWPLWEPSGAVANCLVNPAQNGAYTGVTLGQSGIGDGRTCPYYDGVTDYLAVDTVAVRTAFNGQEGSFFMWAKAYDADVWLLTDGRMNLMRIAAGGDNWIHIRKSSAADNRLEFAYEANNVRQSYDFDGWSSLAFFQAGMTWSKSADEVRFFVAGTQRGATQNGLNTWVGTPVDWCIGAFDDTPLNPSNFYLAHAALWDYALPPTAVANLAVV